MNRTPVDRLALVLVIIGAVNWLLVGLFNIDLVTAVFGGWLFNGTISFFSRAIFTIVGIAGLFSISLLFRESERESERESDRESESEHARD